MNADERRFRIPLHICVHRRPSAVSLPSEKTNRIGRTWLRASYPGCCAGGVINPKRGCGNSVPCIPANPWTLRTTPEIFRNPVGVVIRFGDFPQGSSLLLLRRAYGGRVATLGWRSQPRCRWERKRELGTGILE